MDCCAECKTRMLPLALLLSVGSCRLATVEDIMGGKVYMLYVAVNWCGLYLALVVAHALCASYGLLKVPLKVRIQSG